MIELFECVGLSAKISRAQCKINRSRQDNHVTGTFTIPACKGCGGLGSPTIINLEEVVVAQKQCRVEGCNKLSQYNTDGMCKAHFSKSKKLAAVAAPVARVEPIASCGECGVIPCACFEDVSTMEVSSVPGAGMSRELADLFDAKRAEWVADLVGATSEYSRSRLFVGMCDAIKGAGY